MRVAVLALVLLPFAARGESHSVPQALIDRPAMLPSNVVEVDVLGNVTSAAGENAGGVLALGLELGLGDGEAGLAVALPAAPGFGFGSVYGSAAWALQRQAAFRFDLGFDHSQGDVGRPNANFYAAGAGLIYEERLSRDFALTFGRARAIEVARFTNRNLGGAGFYTGATAQFDSADVVLYSKQEDAGSQLALNAPFGLLWQVSRSFAATLRAGYEIFIVTSGGSGTQQFIPLGVEAVLTPVRTLDVGLTASFAGRIAQSGGARAQGYADVPMGALWVRLRL